jgi:hypothetical protein
MNVKSDTPTLYDRLGGVYAIATVVSPRRPPQASGD